MLIRRSSHIFHRKSFQAHLPVALRIYVAIDGEIEKSCNFALGDLLKRVGPTSKQNRLRQRIGRGLYAYIAAMLFARRLPLLERLQNDLRLRFSG